MYTTALSGRAGYYDGTLDVDAGSKAIVNARFLYDRVSRVPLVVHDTRTPMPGGIDDGISADLQLTKDSALNAEGAAALQQLGPVRFEHSDFSDPGD